MPDFDVWKTEFSRWGLWRFAYLRLMSTLRRWLVLSRVQFRLQDPGVEVPIAADGCTVRLANREDLLTGGRRPGLWIGTRGFRRRSRARRHLRRGVRWRTDGVVCLAIVQHGPIRRRCVGGNNQAVPVRLQGLHGSRLPRASASEHGRAVYGCAVCCARVHTLGVAHRDSQLRLHSLGNEASKRNSPAVSAT